MYYRYKYKTMPKPKKTIKQYIPNLLSLSRIILTLFLLALIFIPHLLLTAQIIVVAAIVSDKLDGFLARLWKVESELGKKLESIADPFLTFISGIYIFVVLDLTSLMFILCTILLGVGSLGRLAIQAKYNKMFYEKSILTKLAVGLTYVILLFYFFQLPYREIVFWTSFCFGIVAAGNYYRMMINFARRQKTSN